jgi:hypothetical protein
MKLGGFACLLGRQRFVAGLLRERLCRRGDE